jgi:N-acetylated-alpha-linked acidic dipeptidase
LRETEGDTRPVDDATLVDTRIGSGSDHTVFLNHLGIPTIGLEFDGPYGVYHSMYDNYYWMSNVGDPGYRYHTLMSVLWGVVALRLANADALPFDFEFYARNLHEFVHELELKKDVKQNLDLHTVDKRVEEFEAAGVALKQAVANTLASGRPNARVNQQIRQVELNWLNADGIPGRPWFKHILYAARFTYAHLELPGLTEAIESGDWKTAATQARILEAAIAKNAALLRMASVELNKGK